MRKATAKLQHVIEKLSFRYGNEDPDVRQLQSELERRLAIKSEHPERRRYGPAATAFLTPAKRIYYASEAAEAL